MGIHIIDKYSLLHFAVGIIAYFWSISFYIFIIYHIIFEYIENTQFGMNIINTYFQSYWPGGKNHPDNFLNKSSDVIFSAIGWILAYYIDKKY